MLSWDLFILIYVCNLTTDKNDYEALSRRVQKELSSGQTQRFYYNDIDWGKILDMNVHYKK